MTSAIALTWDFGNKGARAYTGLGGWNSDHTEFLLDQEMQLVSDWPSCAPDLTSTPLALAFKDHEPKAWGQSALQYIRNEAYHVEPYPKRKFAELAREKPDKGLRDIMAGMKYLWEHLLQHVLENAENYYGLSERPAIGLVGIGVPPGWPASLVQLFLETTPDFGCPIIVRTETSAILQSYLHGIKPEVGQVYAIADHGSSTQNFGLSEVVQVDPLITRELASGGSKIGACTLDDILRERVVEHMEHVGATASSLREDSKETRQIIDRFIALEFELLKYLADNDDFEAQPVDVKPEPFIVTKNFMDEIRQDVFTQMNEPWAEFLSQCQEMLAEIGKGIKHVVVSGGISGSKGLQNFIEKAHPEVIFVFPKRIKTEDVARGLMYLTLRPESCSRDTVGRHYGIGSDEDYILGWHKEDDKLKKQGALDLSDKISDDEEVYNIPEDGRVLAKTVRWIIYPHSKTTKTFNIPMSRNFDMDDKTIKVDVFTRDPARFSGDIDATKSPRSDAEKVNTYTLDFEKELEEVAKRCKGDTLPYYVLLLPQGEDLKVSVVWDLNGTDMDLEKLLSSDSKCEKSFKVHRAICVDEVAKRKRGIEDKKSNKRLKTSAVGDPRSGQFPAGASARNTIEGSSTQPKPITPLPGPEDIESNKLFKTSEAVDDDAPGDPGSGQFPAGASAGNRSAPSESPSSTSEPTTTPLPGPSPSVLPAVEKTMKSTSEPPLGPILLPTEPGEKPTAISPGSTSILLESDANQSIPASKRNYRKGSRKSAQPLVRRKATPPPLHQNSITRNVSVLEGLHSWTRRTPITLKFSKKLLQAIHSKNGKIYRQIHWRETESIWRLPALGDPESHVYFLFSSACSNSFVITNYSTGTKPGEIPDANDIDRRTKLDLMFDNHLQCHSKHVLVPRNKPLYIKASDGPTEGFLIFLRHPGIENDTKERKVMMWGPQFPLYLPVDTLEYPMGLARKLDRSIDLHITNVNDFGDDHLFTNLQCDNDQLKTLVSHLGVKETSNVSGGLSTFFLEAAAGKAMTMEQEAKKAMEEAMLKRQKQRISKANCKRHQDGEPMMAEKIKRGARLTSDNKGFDDESTNVASSREECVGGSLGLLAGDLGSDEDSEDDEFDLADYSDSGDD